MESALLLQGIIETKHVEALEVLLRGLCDCPRETLKIHEICLKNTLGSELHLLCDLSKPTPAWSVKLQAGALRGSVADQLPASHRSVVESKMSSNALRFFYAIGYKLDYELMRLGFSFCFHQRSIPITINVTSVCKIPKLHCIDEATPVTPGIQLVEVTAPSSGDNKEVASAMLSFAELVSPLVHLSKPENFAGVVPTASNTAASLLSRSDKI